VPQNTWIKHTQHVCITDLISSLTPETLGKQGSSAQVLEEEESAIGLPGGGGQEAPHATNQQLLKRLQRYAALEAEVVRLRGLLFDVRGKINSESDCIVGSVKCTDPSLCFDIDGEELAAVPEESSVPTIMGFLRLMKLATFHETLTIVR
jgi:hypothetical protein